MSRHIKSFVIYSPKYFWYDTGIDVTRLDLRSGNINESPCRLRFLKLQVIGLRNLRLEDVKVPKVYWQPRIQNI